MSTLNVSLDEDTIDDLLYSARVGDKDALEADLTTLASKHDTTPFALVNAASDEVTGNSVVHYACANGHQGAPVDIMYISTMLIPQCRRHSIHSYNEHSILLNQYDISITKSSKHIRQYASSLCCDERPPPDC